MAHILAAKLNELLASIEPEWGGEAATTVERLFEALDEGHICLDETVMPDLPRISRTLRKRGKVVGTPGSFTPLIFDNDRLYFARYWKYESDVADGLTRLASPHQAAPDAERLKTILDQFFTANRDPDQAATLIGACTRRLVVITGGPGTGKTTTVAKILAACQVIAGIGSPLTIRLAAYTGKAADRLRESIAMAKSNLAIPPEFLAGIPEEASTIHRLLEMNGPDQQPRRNAANPLTLDLLVVDEASMIDLSMMAKLLYALPPEASLLLLGDKDQLDAVQPGNVFGDICGAMGFSENSRRMAMKLLGASPDPGQVESLLADSIYLLRHSYRFDAESGIGKLAKAVNAGSGRDALEVLRSDPSGQIAWRESTAPGEDPSLHEAVTRWLAPYFETVREGAPPSGVFEFFNRCRLLTPLRHGPDDVGSMNAKVTAWVRREYLGWSDAEWYAGRPIMITENNYSLGLFNGDIGITLADSAGRLSVVFPAEGPTWRRISIGRLPAFDEAYATTVHKSQGSEYEKILLLIPDSDTPVLSRNLLYTGITRAKKECALWGTERSILAAIARSPVKASGLADRLIRKS